MSQCAVVTMVYNEPIFLPHWLRYYSKQLGEECCYVVDHGSDDGSTGEIGGANRLRIPRSPMHDKKRAEFISDFCSSLLQWYSTVIYTDVDEFLIPDPEQYKSLSDFCSRNRAASTNAIELNIIHSPDTDPKFEENRPIIGQRQWARFSFAMCKPLVARVPIQWTPGFHSSNHPPHFDRLFLFHARNFDLPSALLRLAKTREMPWDDGPPDHYQRWTDEQHEKTVRAQANLPKIQATLREDDLYIRDKINWVFKFVAENPDKKDLFYYNNGIPCNELIQIPERFFGHV